MEYVPKPTNRQNDCKKNVVPKLSLGFIVEPSKVWAKKSFKLREIGKYSTSAKTHVF